MHTNTVIYLKQKRMHVTPARCALLTAFFEHQGYLSHKQISSILGVTFDRATIYRTIEVFLQKNIIHSLPGSSSKVNYALSVEISGYSFAHRKNYIYFMCGKCGTALYLENVSIPSVRLPVGFTGTDVEVIVKGTCLNCQTSEQ